MTKKEITNIDSINQLTEQEILGTFIAIRDAQTTFVRDMIAPSLEENNSVILLKYNAVSVDEFKKNILEKSINMFKYSVKNNPFLVIRLHNISFDDAPMPETLHEFPCGLYEFVLPDWMTRICEKALEINPDCNKDGCVLGWNYKGKMTTDTFDNLKVPEPFRERIWFDPNQELKRVPAEEYWTKVQQTFSEIEVNALMIVKAIL